MVLVKLQVAYHMSVLVLTFSQARGPPEDKLAEHNLIQDLCFPFLFFLT